ncbi:MAG: hypothetical protein ACOX3W_05895 [Christensenellaceae bacterium]|jgi:Zn-dependent protease
MGKIFSPKGYKILMISEYAVLTFLFLHLFKFAPLEYEWVTFSIGFLILLYAGIVILHFISAQKVNLQKSRDETYEARLLNPSINRWLLLPLSGVAMLLAAFLIMRYIDSLYLYVLVNFIYSICASVLIYKLAYRIVTYRDKTK